MIGWQEENQEDQAEVNYNNSRASLWWLRPKEQHTVAELRMWRKVTTLEIDFRYSYTPEGDHSNLLNGLDAGTWRDNNSEN